MRIDNLGVRYYQAAELRQLFDGGDSMQTRLRFSVMHLKRTDSNPRARDIVTISLYAASAADDWRFIGFLASSREPLQTRSFSSLGAAAAFARRLVPDSSFMVELQFV